MHEPASSLSQRNETGAGMTPGRVRPGRLATVLGAAMAACGVVLLSHRAGAAREIGVNVYTAEHEKSPQVDQYYTHQFREDARREQERFRPRIALPDAVGDDVPTLAAVEAANAPPPLPDKAAASVWQFWTLAFAVIGSGLYLLRRGGAAMLHRIRDRVAPWESMRGGVLADEDRVRQEAQAFAEFAAAFRTGPALRESVAETAPLESFLARWPGVLASLRKQLAEVQQATDAGARRRGICDLSRELSTLKGETGMPELLSVWQMICAVEGLLKQLGDKINEVTPSTLRTVANGLDLLGELCQPGLDAQLLNRQPVRLLAVDDDPVCRHAISFALKRTLHAPELATDGVTGLARATETSFDVIFLDVEMPGMNGFELCTQIHQTERNRTTPVVFVTNRGDFEARVEATLSGGCDLIAKPFLTFELAVKALALILQHRLRAVKVTAPAPVLPVAVGATKPAGEPMRANPPGRGSDLVPAAPGPVPKPGPTDVAEIATEFLTRAPEQLNWINGLLRDALTTADESSWLQTLADVYLRLHSFTPQAKFAQGHPAMQLASALERLIRKLLQKNAPPSKGMLDTVTTGVALLQEVCGAGANVSGGSEPIQALVVDDDPVARRAMVGVLQTMMPKPMCAENGTAALALAGKRRFDVIVLDVQMPGMDGIEAFARLREGGGNQTTPVLFVSGRNDIHAAIDADSRDDCDVVVKPYLPAELLVKLLSLVLRHRGLPRAKMTG